jgi:hypothetical protein
MSLAKRYADSTYAAEAVTAFGTAIGTASTSLQLPSEDTATVKRLSRMGLKKGSFAREALQLARVNSTLLPVGLDLNRMERTIANRDMIEEKLAQVEQLYQKLRTALVLHGVDAFSDALTVYNSLQRNGTEQSLKDAVAHLGRMFKKNKTSEEDEEMETTSTPLAPSNNNSSTPTQS